MIAGLGFTTRHASNGLFESLLHWLFFLISKVLLSRTSTSFYLNWHNRDEDCRLYRRHTNLCQFPLILFIWNITAVIGYDNKEKSVRFQRKPYMFLPSQTDVIDSWNRRSVPMFLILDNLKGLIWITTYTNYKISCAPNSLIFVRKNSCYSELFGSIYSRYCRKRSYFLH